MLDINEEELKKLYTDGVKIRDIARHWQCSNHTILKRVKKLGLKRERLVLYEDITDQKFNKLTAIKFTRLDRFGKALWLFRCDCGKEKVINASAVKAKLTTSCGCNKQKSLRKQGIGLISHTFFKKLHLNSIKRHKNLTFDLDKEFLWELFLKQNKKCAVSGVDIIISPDSNRERSMTASLDRIDSEKGYTKENVQWVHKRINRMKNILSMEELVFWSKKIVEKCTGIEEKQFDPNILTWD